MRACVVFVAAVLAAVGMGCGSPTGPSSTLSVVVTPNPLRVPQDSLLLYDVSVTAPTRVGVRIDRMETRVVGSSGATYLHSVRHLSPSAGCEICNMDERISAGATTSYQLRGTFINGQPRPGTLQTIVYATDGNGNPLTARVDVPLVP